METPTGDGDPPRDAPRDGAGGDGNGDGIDALRSSLEQTFEVGQAALALLRAELRLARSSAQSLVWLALGLVVLTVGAWLAIGAALAAGIYELTGNVFFGIGGLAVLNLVGAGVLVFMMRARWRDLSLPRTRSALGRGDGAGR